MKQISLKFCDYRVTERQTYVGHSTYSVCNEKNSQNITTFVLLFSLCGDNTKVTTINNRLTLQEGGGF